jgi:hypothetical protein
LPAFGNGRRQPVEKFAPTSAQVEELKQCARDPIYFANKYCKIKHPHRGTLPLKTYPFQDRCLRAFQKHRFNIVLKSRQLGLSTISAAYSVWMALFKRDKNILIIATKLSTAKNFIIKVVKILDSLPPWMRICDYDKNQQEIRFENGSQIKAVPTTEDAGRSEALSLLIIDEAAFVRNFEEIWAALFPTLSEGGGAIVLSTPNGVGGQYYDLWVGAETNGFDVDAVGENGFHPIKLPWNVHPEHDEEYFEATSKKLGPRKTAQELLCDFLSSGETFLKAATMSWISKEQRAPIRREGPEDAVWVWRDADRSHKYLIGADVARGDASDNSTFVVIDMTIGEIVAEYQGKIYPDGMAEILDQYGRLYNNALVVVEANTYGAHTLIDLKKLGYPNIFYRTAPAHSIEKYYATPKDKAGFDTQTASRMEALIRFEDSMRCHVVTPRSSRYYEEAQSFVWLDEKPQAKKNKRDDLIMATAIACWVYRTYFENYRLSCKSGSTTSEKPLFVHMSRSSSTFSGFRTSLPPTVMSSDYKRNSQKTISIEEKSKQIQDATKTDDELKWLLS